MKTHVFVGPPGSGKTTRLLRVIDTERSAGTPLERIAVLTFTRAASAEVRDRLYRSHSVPVDAVPHIRTIHSAALRLTRGDGFAVLNDEDWDEFAERYGYEFTRQGAFDDYEGDVALPPLRTPDDTTRYVYEWGRNRRLDPIVGLGRCPINTVGVSAFKLFVGRFEAFKLEKQRHDFVDILERALASGVVLPVDVGIVDEAQDLSPLQSAVVEQFFRDCARVYIAGDDDQAIFQFQGGRADWFLKMAQTHSSEVLARSHRLPPNIKSLADTIIARNRDRLTKHFAPSERTGSIEHASQRLAIDRIDGHTDTLVLARSRIFLRPYADELVDRLIPFVVEGRGGRNPLGDPGFVLAFATMQQLREGADFVPAGRLRALFKYIPESCPYITREARDKVQHAAKDGFVYQRAGLIHGLELGPMLDALAARGAAALLRDTPPWKLRYLEGLWRVHGEVPMPKVVLTSIHASKGREADRVIVIPNMTPATARSYGSSRGGAYDSENRIAYVAVTRTKSELVLVEPTSNRRFNYPRTKEATRHE